MCSLESTWLLWGSSSCCSYISPWTGRFYSLLDPTYAKDHIPIIASVSEHQPTAWSSFMFEFHILLFFFPAGLYFCSKGLTDATIFVMLYGLTNLYFAGVMVRLILVAAPAMCLISAIAVSFGKKIWDSGAGLAAASLIAICPGYISRSVAGSYDNEGGRPLPCF
jgi:dolichyl-diphosphooligosaccharide--protein glycosyltransferase